MELKMRAKPRTGPGSEGGYSLIELMFATFLITIGMAAGLIMIVIAIQSNTRNKLDTSGTAVAQTVLEQINSIPTTSSTTSINITDCASVAHPVAVVPGASNGAPLLSQSLGSGVDFTQPAVTNYQMYYTTCGGAQYDVRWHVETIDMITGYADMSPVGTPDLADSHVRLLDVSARFTGASVNNTGGTQNLNLFAPPVTLRVITGP